MAGCPSAVAPLVQSMTSLAAGCFTFQLAFRIGVQLLGLLMDRSLKRSAPRDDMAATPDTALLPSRPQNRERSTFSAIPRATPGQRAR